MKLDNPVSPESSSAVFSLVGSPTRLQVQNRQQCHRLPQSVGKRHPRGEFIAFKAISNYGPVEARLGVDAVRDHFGET